MRSILFLVLVSCSGERAVPPARSPDQPAPAVVSEPAPAPAPAPEPELAAADLTVPTGDPAAFAERLVEVEGVIRDPSIAPGPVLDTWGHLQQRLYRALAADPALRDQVVPLVPVALRSLVERHTSATADALATITRARSELPAWTIVEPPSVDQLMTWYEEAEAATGTPWTLLAAVHLVETRLGRLRGTSHAGAQGPMQFIPETWRRYGEGDVNDPRDAILGAGNYLAKMGAPGNIDKALWHYNQSKSYGRAVRTWHELLAEEPLALRGYHGWQVYYRTTRGPVWLPVGYSRDEKIPVDAWCSDHPGYCP